MNAFYFDDAEVGTPPDGYAFPIAPGDVPYWQPGMTLRDYIAVAALPLAHADDKEWPASTRGEGGRFYGIARLAYSYADAMMRARAEEQDA